MILNISIPKWSRLHLLTSSTVIAPPAATSPHIHILDAPTRISGTVRTSWGLWRNNRDRESFACGRHPLATLLGQLPTWTNPLQTSQTEAGAKATDRLRVEGSAWRPQQDRGTGLWLYHEGMAPFYIWTTYWRMLFRDFLPFSRSMYFLSRARSESSI